MRTVRIKVTGIVQGIGFRPFVYKLAAKYKLSGFVNNFDSDVIIEAEGLNENITGFIEDIREKSPQGALIYEIKVDDIPGRAFDTFQIKQSESSGERKISISPDIGVCSDCLKELYDQSDRRFAYPFINCTNCGPRYTIIENIPYDRPYTSMKDFIMCDKCSSEYRDPLSRRFHAQPNACRQCGPFPELIKSGNEVIKSENPVKEAAELIKKGYIIAVKGIGGYHLACDAFNKDAVCALRQRKLRDGKPFALMAPDLEKIREICEVSFAEESLLKSPAAPIVILKRKKEAAIPKEIAPNQRSLGFMLPYSPLHSLLLNDIKSILVMTSANISDSPLCFRDGDALGQLSGIADFFLTNNRRIYMRCDDSVTRIYNGKEYPLRRSRGYVPGRIKIPFATEVNILACGGELKNTVCLLSGDSAVLSGHIGDLINPDSCFEETVRHMKKLFELIPDTVAYDMHPDYLSSKYAESIANVKHVKIQHHHAHMAACMAENFVAGDSIGVIFDGLGFGEDGNLWGGEFFTGNYKTFTRRACFSYLPMPGGEMAIKEPWRMALSALSSAFPQKNIWDFNIGPSSELNDLQKKVFSGMLHKKTNLTSSVGRIFDAVSAILGICSVISYEGEAAIMLENFAENLESAQYYPFALNQNGEGFTEIELSQMYREIMLELDSNAPRKLIAAKFHNTIAEITGNICIKIRDCCNLSNAVLSGGVFQNILLLDLCRKKLEKNGFKVYIHNKVPANDGGLSLGQAVIAAARS